MEEKNLQKENQLSPFPEESGLIVLEILKKYGLAEIQEKEIERLLIEKNPEEKIKIFENLPGTKISKLIKEYGDGKISLEEIPIRISQNLNLPENQAREIGKELEKSIFLFITPKKPFKTIADIIFKDIKNNS